MMNKKSGKLSMAISVILLLVISLESSIFANVVNDSNMTATDIDVIHNEEKVSLKNEPFIVDDVVFVPLREVLNLCGVGNAKISWDSWDEGEATIKDLPTEAVISIGSDECYINNMAVRLTGKAQLRNDRTYVPVDFLKVVEICQEDLGGKSIFNNLKIIYNNVNLVEELRISNFARNNNLRNDISFDVHGLSNDIIEAYKNKIIQIYDLNTAFGGYFLYDIDNDGIMELFVGWRNKRVYTFKDGLVEYLGNTYNDAYKLEGESGIYTYGGFGTGVGGTTYYEIRDNRLVSTDGKINLAYTHNHAPDKDVDVIFRYNGERISEEEYNNLVENNFNDSNSLDVNAGSV